MSFYDLSISNIPPSVCLVNIAYIMSIPFSSIAEILQSSSTTSFTTRNPNSVLKDVRYPDRYCGVCGDVTKSFHFGGLCCNSCKSFFRRSIQNDNYLHFYCCHQGRCVLSLSNRKNCRYCRMSRCIAIGMDKSWLWTEEERLVSIQNRTKNKQRKYSGKTNRVAPVGKLLMSYSRPSHIRSFIPLDSSQDIYEPKIENMTDFLTLLEVKEIESVITKYYQAYQSVPYQTKSLDSVSHRSEDKVIEVVRTSVRRFHHFSQLLADFSSLPLHDQSDLLRGGIFEMCLLRLALIYDPINNCWPNKSLPMYRDSPVLYLSEIGRLTSPHLYQMKVDFINWVQRNGLDEPTIMLLVLIVLFTPERVGNIWNVSVEKCQLHYTTLLERYMKWRYGLDGYKPIFCKLLTKLSDLRELSDSYDLGNLQLGNREILSIQEQLQFLEIYPRDSLLDSSRCPTSSVSTVSSPVIVQPTNNSSESFDPEFIFHQPVTTQPTGDETIKSEDVLQVSQMIDERVAFLQNQDAMSAMVSSVPTSTSHTLLENNQLFAEDLTTIMASSPFTISQLFEEIEQCQFEL